METKKTKTEESKEKEVEPPVNPFLPFKVQKKTTPYEWFKVNSQKQNESQNRKRIMISKKKYYKLQN